jgi:hypothetical protein
LNSQKARALLLSLSSVGLCGLWRERRDYFIQNYAKEARFFIGSTSNSAEMSIHPLDLNSPALSEADRQHLCWQYYNLIYEPAFPVPDETEDPTVWLPLMTGEPPADKPLVNILLATAAADSSTGLDGSLLLGGINFEYYRASRAVLITYLCVKSDVRRNGVAKSLLGWTVEKVHSTYGDVPLFAEAEDPNLQSASTKQIAIARWQVLHRLGFRQIPIRYCQPSLGAGKLSVDNLKFLVFAGGKDTTVNLSALKHFMREFYASLGGELNEANMFHGLTDENVSTLALAEGK